MKIYVFEFPGHYLGGEATVVAESEKAARALVRKEIKSSGLTVPAKDLKLIKELPANEAVVAFFWDGNY